MIMEDLQGQETVEAPSQDDIDTAQINEWIEDHVPTEGETEVEQQQEADPEVPLEVVPPEEPEAAAPEKEGSTSKAF